MNIVQLFKVEVYLMNLRNTALLTLSLLVVVAPAFAGADDKKHAPTPKVAQSYWAQALAFGSSLVTTAKNRWYVTAPVVAVAATGVAYKASPKVKAKIDAGLSAAQAKVKSTYATVSSKLPDMNKEVTRADALKLMAGSAGIYGLYNYSTTIKNTVADLLLGAYPVVRDGDIDKEKENHVRVGGLKGKLVSGYNYVADTRAVKFVSAQSTTVKVAMVAGLGVLTAGGVKAYQYFKNRKAAKPAANPAPAPAASTAAPVAN